MKFLFSLGANPNYVDSKDMSLLQDACSYSEASGGDTKLIAVTLDAGADINAEKSDGFTVLDSYELGGSDSDPKIVAYLESRGAHKGSGLKSIKSADGKLTAKISYFGSDPNNADVKILKGIVISHSTTPYDYIEIDVNFTSIGAVLESGMANVQHLDARGIWEFTITTATDASSYDLTSLKGN